MTRKSFINTQLTIILLCHILFVQSCRTLHNTSNFTFVDTAPANIIQTMQTNAKTVFAEINKAYSQDKTTLSLSSSNATNKAINNLKSLWNSSYFYCTETNITARILKSPNGYQVRNIPVYFVKGENDDDKYQEVAIDFTKDGKISDMFIALTTIQYKEIMDTSDNISDIRNRQRIIEFLERFRTAYNQKDFQFIQQVFSDDVLVITGKVLKRKNDSVTISTEIQYSAQDVKQFLANLKRVFNSNAYINVTFDNILVNRRGENSNIYGVTLHKKWHTSTYSDAGWLFQIIDFKDENNPLIWVRTWQPYESTPKDQIFGLDDFIIRD